MTRVIIPDGHTVVGSPRGVDPLSTNRSTRYRFDLLDSAGRKFGELDGVSSGSIEWNANSQVKGGGKIVVSKANDVHERDIRVSVTRPLVDQEDFEDGIRTFSFNGELSDKFEPPAVIERTTSEFYEGVASMHIAWADKNPEFEAQNVVAAFTGMVPGNTYTIACRVLNTSASGVYAKVSFLKNVPVPQKEEWQVVTISFTAFSSTMHFGFANYDGVAGTHLYVDSIHAYEGKTTGFNGEVFDYAPFSWMHARIRPVLEIDGAPEQPLGVFLPAAPVEQWDEGGGRQNIELLDRTSIIAQDYVPQTFTVSKWTNVITAVRRIIRSTGERPGAITTSAAATLNADMTWGAGTNKLTIINDLLDAAGYFALWADENGQFRVEEYRPPRRRRVAYSFLDNHNSVYIPTFSIDRDIYSVPNRVIMTAQGDGESEGWTATATNQNEKSEFSFQRRGRWVTDVQLGIEATSLENLQKKAERRLRSLSSVQAAVEIQHAPIPGLRVNDVVRFRRKPADMDTLFTVTKTTINFDPTSLAKSTLTEVVDLELPAEGGTA